MNSKPVGRAQRPMLTTQELARRPVAGRASDGYSLHNPAFVGDVVTKQSMQGGAVVPDNEVMGLPLVFIDDIVN